MHELLRLLRFRRYKTLHCAIPGLPVDSSSSSSCRLPDDASSLGPTALREDSVSQMTQASRWQEARSGSLQQNFLKV